MARKVIGNSTHTSKSKKPNTPWLQNAIRSIGVTSSDVIKDLVPNIYEVGSSGAKIASEIKSSVRSTTVNSAASAISSNKFVKMGNDTLRNAMDDLKTGNLNNTERQAKAIEASMGLDDSFGTFLDDSDWDDDGSGTTVQQFINNDDGSSANAITVAASDLNQQMYKQSENQIKAAKANMDTMITIGSAQMALHQNIGNEIINHLGNISNSLQTMVEYNNNNMNRYIESSIAFMEKYGSNMDSGDSRSSMMQDSVYNNGSGGINISNYRKHVMDQVKKQFKDSNVGFAAGLLKDNPEMITSNPVGFASKFLVGAMVPSIVKETLTGVEEAFSGFVPTMLAKVSELSDVSGKTLQDNILRLFGKTFGVKMARSNSFDLSSAATNDSISFDKMSKHALVEIIPKYLRESTSYLKELVTILGGDTKSALSNAQAFDYQRGKYRNTNDIDDDVYGNIRNSVITKMGLSSFGSGLRTSGSKLDSMNQEKYNDLLDDFFVGLEKHGKALDVTNFNKNSDLMKILTSLNGDPTTKKYLEASLMRSSRNKAASLNANVAIQQAVASRKTTIENMENDPYSYNLYTSASDKGDDIDNHISTTRQSRITTTGRNSDSKLNPTSLLNDIKGILSRGINVKIVKGSPFGPYSTLSSTESSTITVESSPMKASSSSMMGDVDISKMSAEDISKMIESDDALYTTQSKTAVGKKISSAGEHIQNAMYAIAYGNSSLAFDEIGSIVGDKVVSIGKSFKEKFLDPMISTVLGTKDQNGYSKDGLMSGMQNKFLDTYRSFQREFSGKGYTDSMGNRVEDKKDGEASVVGNIKGVMRNIKKTTMDYILGEQEVDADGNPIGKRGKGQGILGFMTTSLRDGFDGFSEFIFGKNMTDENRDSQRATIIKYAKDKIKESTPAALTGTVLGTVGGAMMGGSLLGTLVGGPLGGALIGTTVGILSKSNRFQDWLFGEKDEETQERLGGLISKNVQDTFKKNKVNIIGGATIGAAKNMIFGGGLMGSLVGGPIAGALIGGVGGYLVKTKQFQEFMYGSEVTDESGNTKRIGGVLNSFKHIFGNQNKENSSLTKKLGMGVIGAGIGSLGASALGSMGLMGSMLTPFGPIGGAIAGFALSMKASNRSFREYMFGSDYTDEDGNSKHKNGVLQKFGNMLQVELFEPMRDGLKNFTEDSQDFIIDKMLAPVEFAIAPLAERVKDIASGIKDKVTTMIDAVGSRIKRDVIDPIVDNTRKFIISPMKKVFGTMFSALWGVSKMMISAPFSALALMTNFNDARNRRSSRNKVMGENISQNGFVRGMGQNVAIALNMKNARKDAEYKYTDYAEEWDERKRLYNEDRVRRTDEHRNRAEERRQTSKNRRTLGRWTGYDNVEDTEENRKIAQDKYNQYRKSHRFSTLLKSSKLDFYGDPMETLSTPKRSTASSILKETNGDKLGVVEGIFRDVHSIAQSLTGGKSFFKSGKSDNKDNTESPNRHTKSSTEANGSTDEEINDDITEGFFSRIKNRFNSTKESLNFKEGYKNSYLKNKMTSIKDHIKNFKLPGFADGTEDAPEGIAIVGERGPEVVRFGGGEKVFSNNDVLKVSLVDIGEMMLMKTAKFFAKIVGQRKQQTTIAPNNIDDIISLGGSQLALPFLSSNNDNGDNIIDALSSKVRGDKNKSALDKVRNAKSYDSNMAAKKAADKENREVRLLEAVEGQRGESKDHFNLWSSIFSKKGLITGALLALSPLLYKFFKNLDIGQIIKDAIGDIRSSFINGTGQLENGDTPSERLNKNGKDLNKGIMDWIAPNGNLDHESGAKANLFTQHIVKPTSRLLNKATKKITGKDGITVARDYFKNRKGKRVPTTDIPSGSFVNYADNAYSIIDDIPLSNRSDLVPYNPKNASRKLLGNTSSNIIDANYWNAVDVPDNTQRGIAKRFTNTKSKDIIDASFSFVDDGAEGVGKKLLASSGDVASVAAKKKTTIIGKVKEALSSFLSNTMKYLEKKGVKIGNIGKSLTDDALRVVEKNFPKVAAKITAILGGTTAVAATGVGVIAVAAKEVTWVTLGAVNGLTGAARLFQVDKSYVDGTMTLISAAIGALASTTIGSVVDIVNELVVDVLGVDFVHELAVIIYHFLSGNEKYNSLKVGQAEFTDKYDTYKESEIEKQRQTYMKMYGNDISREEFQEGVDSGNIKVNYKSFADYNDENHQTLGTKLYNNTIKKGWNAGKAISGFSNKLLFGNTNEFYTDENGNQYKLNKTGSYDVTDSSGKSLGYISKEELPESARINKTTQKKDGLVQIAGKGIKKGFDIVGSAGNKVGGDALAAGKGMLDGVLKITKNFYNKDMDFKEYIQADVNTVPEDNMFRGFTGTLLNMGKIVLFPKLLLSGVANKINDKVQTFIDDAKQKAAVATDTIGTNMSSMISLAKNGDVSGLHNYSINIDDDTPVAGIVKALTYGGRFLMYPLALTSFMGKKVHDGVSTAVEAVKTVGGDIATSAASVVKLAISGNHDSMMSYTPSISEDNPVSGFVKGIIGVEKMILSPISLLTTSARTLADKVMATPAGNVIKDAGNYVTVLNKYTDSTVSMDGFGKEIMANSQTDPARLIVGSLINKVMRIYVDIVRGIRSVAQLPEKVKEKAGVIVTGVKEKASQAGQTIVKTFNNGLNGINATATNLMNMGRGGKGPSVEADKVNNFPYYSQKDSRWGNTPYGIGNNNETIADAGCGPDAMAMVATKMTGRKITPIEVASDAKMQGYRDESGTNWGFVGSAASKYGLNSNMIETPNKQYIKSELSKGNPVMLSGVGDGVSSPYTYQGHYVVAVGADGDDIIVNDPRGSDKSGRYNIDNVVNTTGAAWSFNKGNNTGGGRGASRRSNIIKFPRSGGAIASDEESLSKARQAVVSKMMSLQGKLHYTQQASGREKVIQGYAGDCSSTVRWVYRSATGIDPGSYTGAQIASSKGSDVDNTPGCPNERNLLPGDLIFYANKNSKTVGHVEMYIGNGQIMGHGGPSWDNMGPSVKSLAAYSKERLKSGKGYLKTRRFILSKNAEHIKLDDAANISVGSYTDNTTNTSTKSNDSFFDKIGNFFTSFADKAWTGMTTGVWNTDYSSVFNGSTASTDSDSSYSDISVASDPISGDYVGKYVKKFESGGRGSSTIGHSGNDGGLSYGSYQFIWKNPNGSPGAAQKFWNTYYADKYGKANSYMDLKSKWLQASKEDPTSFFKNEHEYAYKNYYSQAQNKLSNLNPNAHSRAVQESLWSWAIHRGGATAAKEFNSIGLDNPQNMSASSLLDKIYDKRSAVMSQNGYTSIAANRYGRSGSSERATLQQISSMQPINPSKIGGYGGGKGGNDNGFSINKVNYYNPVKIPKTTPSPSIQNSRRSMIKKVSGSGSNITQIVSGRVVIQKCLNHYLVEQ